MDSRSCGCASHWSTIVEGIETGTLQTPQFGCSSMLRRTIHGPPFTMIVCQLVACARERSCGSVLDDNAAQPTLLTMAYS